MNQQIHATDVRVLVVEDDAEIRDLIVDELRREGYTTGSADSLAEARAVINQEVVKLIVLDRNMPDGDGIKLCRELRAEGYEGAIIMVTSRSTPIDRVMGLELGADDYLTKPFEPLELLARVRNLIKRVPDQRQERKRTARIARFGSWRLDLLQRRLIAPNDRLVMLSAAEYRLLCQFVEAPGKVLSREMLRPERSATAAFDRSTDLLVSRVRHKLGTEPNGAEVLVTVRNEGYVMPGPVTFE